MEAKGETLSDTAPGSGSSAGGRAARVRAAAQLNEDVGDGDAAGENEPAGAAAALDAPRPWAADTFLENLLRSLASPEEELERTESTLLRIKMTGRGCGQKADKPRFSCVAFAARVAYAFRGGQPGLEAEKSPG